MPFIVAQEAPEPVTWNLTDTVMQSLTELGVAFQRFVPGFIGGLIIFLVGLFVALIVRRVLTTILSKIGLDKVSERVGLKDLLSSFGIKASLPVIIGKFVFIVMVLMFLMSGTQVVPGLTAIAEVLKNLVTYFPRAASAILYALAGLLVARFAHGALLSSAERVGLEYARPLANLVYGFLVIVVLTLAFGQMDIETELLSKTIQISLGSIALALALAIGLGMTSIAKHIAAGVYARDLFPPGTEVQIDDDRDDTSYRVIAVGATSTRLEDSQGTFLVMPNSTMIETSIRGRHPKVPTPKTVVLGKKKRSASKGLK